MAFSGEKRTVNIDDDAIIEQDVALPWASDPAGSYLYYECSIMTLLDSGIVVHNRLPQVNRTPDTLSATTLDAPDMDKIINKGVNLRSQDQYTDIVQRMAHSRYWFRLWGQAIRVGYQVPIPGIKTIGGVPAIPHDKNPQWAYNRMAPSGNYGGIILWKAAWSLWYTTAAPPTSDVIPAADPTAHINQNTRPPVAIQVPLSAADDSSTGGRVLGNTIFVGSK